MKNSSNEWTDEDIEALLVNLFFTLCAIIFISFILVKLQGGSSATSNRGARGNATNSNRNNGRNPTETISNDDDDCWYKTLLNPLSHKLVDGVLPFRFCSASRYNLSLTKTEGTTTTAATNTTTSHASSAACKETLQMLASIFYQKQNDSSIVPKRGCNVVISLDESTISSSSTDKLKNILMVLGTTYNLFVILSLPLSSSIPSNDPKQIENKVSTYRAKLYQMGLSFDVILPHRVIACSSLVGRVAFVRQLKPDVVIDFDADMSEQLSRFGFRVIVVDNDFYS